MFTRTATPVDVPEREKLDTEQLCPPHEFSNGWALHKDSTNGEDTKPALFCVSCGEVRLFRIPDDAA